VGAVPLTAPRTPFNGALTPQRRVSFARVSLTDVKAVKDATGCTVNDVVLALMAGTLRRYLEARHVLPDEPLIAVCPMSVRLEDERGQTNNRVSAMFTSLATDVDDPLERLRAISRVTKGAKEDHNAIGARFLQDWAEHAAPTTFALASRLYARLGLADRHRPIHNLVISNVPGPPFPLYYAGAQLVAAYPMGPVMQGAGLNVTVMSYMDNVDIGFMACRELVPDVWDLPGYVDEAMSELLASSGLRQEALASATAVPAKVPAAKRSKRPQAQGQRQEGAAKKGLPRRLLPRRRSLPRSRRQEALRCQEGCRQEVCRQEGRRLVPDEPSESHAALRASLGRWPTTSPTSSSTRSMWSPTARCWSSATSAAPSPSSRTAPTDWPTTSPEPA
jgi:diacylglycerol O-acyltransferase / wax synthase